MEENAPNPFVVAAMKKSAIEMLTQCRKSTELQIEDEDTVNRLTRELHDAEESLSKRKERAESEFDAMVVLYNLAGENFTRNCFSIQSIRAVFNLPNTRGSNDDPLSHRAADRVARKIEAVGKRNRTITSEVK